MTTSSTTAENVANVSDEYVDPEMTLKLALINAELFEAKVHANWPKLGWGTPRDISPLGR